MFIRIQTLEDETLVINSNNIVSCINEADLKGLPTTNLVYQSCGTRCDVCILASVDSVFDILNGFLECKTQSWKEVEPFYRRDNT